MTHLWHTILFICDKHLLSGELPQLSSYSENCLYVQWISINRFQDLKNVSILLFIAGCGKWMWLDLWDTTPAPLCVCWTYYQTQVVWTSNLGLCFVLEFVFVCVCVEPIIRPTPVGHQPSPQFWHMPFLRTTKSLCLLKLCGYANKNCLRMLLFWSNCAENTKLTSSMY